MIDLSVLIPSLRPHNLIRFYNSLIQACAKYSWELVAIGPFEPPQELLSQNNFKFISSYSSVPVCIQKATLECQGVLIAHQVDDGVLLPDSFDECIKFYKQNCLSSDVINCRYREGVNFQDNEKPAHFWKAGVWDEYKLPGIDPEWSTCCQPLMLRELFIYLGGFDCRYEYSNYPHMDFIFRVQKNGGKVYQSPVEICVANHFPGTSGDHSAIHYAQTGPDTTLFREIYNTTPLESRIKIPYDNYKPYDVPWKRRFSKGLYRDYKELCEEEGYKL